MTEVVIDTNVLLVANGAHAGVSDACVQACVEGLLDAQGRLTVVLDDSYRIVMEYQNKLQPSGGKGVGDAFLKWLMQQLANPEKVSQVSLDEIAEYRFREFPAPAIEDSFDPSDRKFAAVANAHLARPPIWQAADCKWLQWWTALSDVGITTRFLCPDDVCRFHTNKFPGRPVPALP